MSRMSLEKLLVIDFEATCWQEQSSSEKSEIIEIGYCLIEGPTEVAQKRYSGSIKVLPDLLDVSPFSTSIHGIVAKDLVGCPSLAQAFDQLKAELNINCLKSIPWASYGDYDREQLIRECSRKGITYPLSRTHFNIKTMYSLLRGRPRIDSGLSVALEREGYAFQGRQHSGEDDANNAATLLMLLRS